MSYKLSVGMLKHLIPDKLPANKQEVVSTLSRLQTIAAR